MSVNNVELTKDKAPEAFAKFFHDKVNDIVNNTIIDENIHNGFKKLNSENLFFMSSTDLKECIKNIKIKNCEGYDRIPQRVIVDGFNTLKTPLEALFNKIYHQKTIPEQWLISKITPIHKKVLKHQSKTIDLLQTSVPRRSYLSV